MKYLLTALTLLLFSACSGESEKSYTSVEANPKKATLPVEKEPVKQIETQKEPQAVAETKKTTAPVTTAQKQTAPKKEPAVTSEPQISGAALFTKNCQACHGTKAEKKAMNKSQIIAGWEAKKVINALTGYQNGTYGQAMKGVMQGVIKKFSADEIKHLADHISSLK